jgi:pimeloyl-ACP methyl ester carboxylesterase
VPLDHANPSGDRIELALLRLPAKSPAARIGSLLVNPGGPGGSGVEFARRAASLFESLRGRFDIVGFDPRGVGRSTAIRCLTDGELDRVGALDPTPDTQEERGALVAAARAHGTLCARRAPRLLPYLTTEQTARDLDLIRAAVGDEKLTYLGFSYGTELGATYASLFPDRVRALALDGAVDPALWAGDPARLIRVQLRGFERSLAGFTAWCARARAACPFAADGRPRAALRRLLGRLDAHPLRVGNRRLTEGLALTSVIGALYSRRAWAFLGRALHLAYARRDGSLLLALADAFVGRRDDGSYTNAADANAAITCADWAVAAGPDPFLALLDDLDRRSPLLGPSAAYSALVCAYWPVAGAVSRYLGPFTASGAPPILVVGTTGDPATPYVWAESLAAQLESGVLLTWRGESHTAYGESECASAAIDRYLVETVPPAEGTVCRD